MPAPADGGQNTESPGADTPADDPAARHLGLVESIAADGADRAGRPGAIASVNAHLWRVGALPRSFYTGDNRPRLLAALNRLMAHRGWPHVADHELHDAPEGGLPPPPSGRIAERPDPWLWVTPHAVSRTRCTGAMHRIVFDRGTVSHPDHEDGPDDAPCHRLANTRTVWRALEQAGVLRRIGPTWFTERGITTARLGQHRFDFGIGCPDLHDDARDRFPERGYLFDHTAAHEGFYLPQSPLTVHDPLRPDLTTITGLRRPDPPPDAWWAGQGVLEISLTISAWWDLEVARQPWARVSDLLTLQILTWDLERRLPNSVLLLDWCDDPTARPAPGEKPWHVGGPIVPVLIRAETTHRPDGSWEIFDIHDRRLVTG
jgi:hypothetical protein